MTTISVSPPLSSKRRARAVTGIVLHSTAGRENPASSAENAISTLRGRSLAYHYIIAKDGTVYKCCPASAQASHAGASAAWGGANCNGYTIGICFVNADGCESVAGKWKFTGKVDPITTEQWQSARRLVAELKKQFPLIEHLTTHHYCAVPKGRKIDPFGMDVAKFADEVGVALWKPAWASAPEKNR